MPTYITRQIQPLIAQLQAQFPALLITGPRQVGKSTLLQHVAPDYRYVSFDDPLLREQAASEPALFMLNHPGRLVLDEVQHVPALFSSLKLAIDRQQQNGLFLLSGSQAFGLMQHVSESMAGRVAVLKLSGLSLREIQGMEMTEPFIPSLTYLEQREKTLVPCSDLWQLIHRGYMPRLHQQDTNWDVYYASYVATYIERDVRQLANIDSTNDFTRFMAAIAARSGELLNYSSVAQDVGVSVDTIRRWTTVLQTSGIIHLLAPYSNNHLKRAIKTPKLYMMDTGLMAWLTKWLTPDTIRLGARSGQFFETFVVSEIIKSFHNRGIEPPIYFYRDTSQKEIDLLIEWDRKLYPVEIKTTARPLRKMGAAFDFLRQQLPANDIEVEHGIIINQYPQKHWLAENLVALPPDYL
ncbi:MAG: ATP-binding protein [Lautropia sp.]|nr:ATP-binding protein [Lautropia sp.]